MQCVFIDPEPPSPVGGGIRAYLRLMEGQLNARGHRCVVYSQNPEAYAGEARSIGRKPFLPRFVRGAAYRLSHGQAVILEQSRWLAAELAGVADRAEAEGEATLFEFADFLGYAGFSLLNPRLRERILVRVHTPAFLIPPRTGDLRERLSHGLCAMREKRCLRQAVLLTAPSAAFMREKLPEFTGYRYLPNPPPSGRKEYIPPETPGRPRFLFLGRFEPRKGPHILLSSFLEFLEDFPEAELTLAGDGAASAYGRALTQSPLSWPEAKRKRLRWLPGQSPAEVRDLLCKHDFLVVPSLWENSPYVFFEGIAAGKVCIGTAAGEMGEVLRESGSPCADAGSAASLARALKQVAGPDFPYGDQQIRQRSAMATRQEKAVEEFLKMAEEITGKTRP